MLLIIIFLPIIFLAYMGLRGRSVGSDGLIFLSILVTAVQSLCAFFLYIESFVSGAVIVHNFSDFIVFDGYSLVLGLLSDRLSSGMLLIVTVISLAVQIYSASYLVEDPHRSRFSSYLQLFTFFMLFLVLSPNYFQLFLGWEGVGLTSYLLVNFWYTRIQANKSGLKALFVNRFGDYFYLFGLFFCWHFYQTFDFQVFLIGDTIVYYRIELLSMLFVLAAAAKSAQLGLHTWLPDAMEGPTPVSALIHAATMVTAGVFLLLRAAPLLLVSVQVSHFLLIFGSLTAFFAASVGAAQFDVKKIIAYSTCSQLGYMIASIGSGSFDICFYHLVNHAFFKALLFLTAGILIHGLLNDQDLRRYGGLIKLMPYSYVIMLVGSLGLTGLPFLSGYYSKDGLLESLLSQEAYFSYWLLILTAGITAYYSARTLYLVFAGTPRFSLNVTHHLRDADILFMVPTITLFILTILHGFLSRDLYLGFGSSLLDINFFSPMLYCEFSLTILQKFIPLLFSFSGSAIGFIIFYKTASMYSEAFRFFNKRWWFDMIDTFSSRSFLFFSKNIYFNLERGLTDRFGERGVIYMLNRFYYYIYFLHDNHTYLIFIITYTTVFFSLTFLSFYFLVYPIIYAYNISKD